jgi:hypothetical protein
MKILVLYLWFLAVLGYALAVYMAIIQQPLGAIALTTFYTAVLLSTRWATVDPNR